MAKEDLNGAEIPRRLVDDRSLRPPERMRSIILGMKTYADDPLVHETRVLSRTHMSHVFVAAREDEVVQGTASAFQPRTHRLAGRVHQLELDRSSCFLLNDDSAVAHTPARDHIANPHFDHVTAAQLAIDSKVEKRSVTKTSVLIQPEADGPDLLLLQCPLGSDQSAFVPRPEFMKGRAHRRVTHHSSPSNQFYQSRICPRGKPAVKKQG
jgi:hypothetical protein